MICFFASEVSALCGQNRWTSYDEAVDKVLKRTAKSSNWCSPEFRAKEKLRALPVPKSAQSITNDTELKQWSEAAEDKRKSVEAVVTAISATRLFGGNMGIAPPPAGVSNATIASRK